MNTATPVFPALFPALYKRTATGGVQIWQIQVEAHIDGSADIVTTFGLVDGKQQVQRDTIREGKNAGRKNATTPLEQAYAEAVAEHKKKIDRKGYGLDPDGDESAAKRAVSPMLAYAYEKYAAGVQWGTAFGQPKLDGHRCLATWSGGELTLASREGKPIPTMRHVVARLQHYLKGRSDIVLDGELYSPELSFEELTSAIKREQASSLQVGYRIYDCLGNEAFEYRIGYVLNLLDQHGDTCVQPVPTIRVRDAAELRKLQVDCLSEGYEGAMLRHGADGYEAGKRSQKLLKVKVFSSAEFRIVGVVEGRGTHAGMAVLQCVTAAGHPFDCLAPGTHTKKMQAWNNRETLIGKKVETKYFEFTTSDAPVPRFPVAIRIHEVI